MNAALISSLLKSLVDDLRSEAPYIYDDHSNLWIEYGWDISQGDGEVSETVEDRVSLLVESLPPIVWDYLWWNSISGRLIGKAFEEAAEQNLDDLNKLSGPTREEVAEDVTEILVSWLRSRAETDYDAISRSDDEVESDEE